MLALEDQIAFISVIDVLLKLTLDLECRWPRAAWNFHVLSLLVKDAKGRRRVRIILLFERNYLKYIRVPHADIHRVREDYGMASRLLPHQRDDLDDVVIEHECNKVSSLA